MKKITLSFDNGPDPAVTPQVLDILRRHDVLTTFFVVGERLRDATRRAACERARAEGHKIGNHSHNHLMPLGMSRTQGVAIREIGEAQKQIGRLSEDPPLFRPSGALGALNETLFNAEAAAYLQQNGYTCVLWNAIPRDWDEPEAWVETALGQCQTLDWPVVVLHDLQTGAMDRLDDFLCRAMDLGMEIVQDFPPDCMPIVGGQVVLPINGYISL